MLRATLAASGAVIALSMAVATPVQAQTTCSNATGQSSCNLTVTASVTVPTLVELNTGSSAITLTQPTAANLGTDIADVGPLLSIKANKKWNLQVNSTEAAFWTYDGTAASSTESGSKPINDFKWATASDGTFTAISSTPSNVFGSVQNRGNAIQKQIYLKTFYDADYAASSNVAGNYSIHLLFTLIAP